MISRRQLVEENTKITLKPNLLGTFRNYFIKLSQYIESIVYKINKLSRYSNMSW